MRTYIFLLLFVSLFSCQKKSADTPIATVPERLDIKESAVALQVGETISLMLSYYNSMGLESPVPSGISWESSNNAVAGVNALGLVSSLSAGQALVYARYMDAIDSVVINVVTNNQSIASIVINPNPGSVLINQRITFSAQALNISGQVISGVSFEWNIADASIASISSDGEALALSHGTTTVVANVDGVSSAPVEIQVIRSGAFSGSGSMGVSVLRITSGILQLETSSDFSVSTSPPDLRIYLTNNRSGISGAEEVGTLNQRSGAQFWNVRSGINISDYRYVMIWCKQFGGSYGVADLGE